MVVEFVLIVVALVLTPGSAVAPINSSSASQINNILSFFNQVADEYFAPQQLVILMSNFSEELDNTSSLGWVASLPRSMSEGSRWPLMVLGPESASGYPFQPLASSYIIATSTDHLLTLVLEARIQPSWNSSARFLVHLIGKPGIEGVRDALNTLMEHEASDVLVSTDSSEPGVLDLYLWYPFTPDYCKNLSSVSVLTRWRGKPLEHDLFPVKIGDDLKGCPLRANARTQPPFVVNVNNHPQGIEINLVHLLAKDLNFTLELRRLERVGNESDIIARLGMLHRREIDIALGGLVPSEDNFQDFSITSYYYRMVLQWWVPVPAPAPSFLLLYRALPFRVVILALSIFLLSAILSYGLQYWHEGRGVIPEILSMWGEILELPVKGGSPESLWSRLFHLAIFVYALHVNLVFRTAITSNLTITTFEPGMESFEELEKNGMRIGAAINKDLYTELFHNESDLRHLRDLHTWCQPLVCVGRLRGRKRRYGVLVSSSLMQYVIPFTLLDPATNSPLVYPLKSPALLAYVSLFLRKGDPLVRHFDQVILRSVQAGLPSVWMQRVIRISQIKALERGISTASSSSSSPSSQKSDDDDDQDDDKQSGDGDALRLTHLEGAFMVVVLGLFFSTLCFSFEMMARHVERYGLFKPPRRSRLHPPRRLIVFQQPVAKSDNCVITKRRAVRMEQM